jgi:ferredoxin
MARGHALEIAIDRIACDGRGICAELLPELIELDDWGYPIVRAGSVPRPLVDEARRAASYCPVLAFRLRPSTATDSGAAPRPTSATATSRRKHGVRGR